MGSSNVPATGPSKDQMGGGLPQQFEITIVRLVSSQSQEEIASQLENVL